MGPYLFPLDTNITNSDLCLPFTSTALFIFPLKHTVVRFVGGLHDENSDKMTKKHAEITRNGDCFTRRNIRHLYNWFVETADPIYYGKNFRSEANNVFQVLYVICIYFRPSGVSSARSEGRSMEFRPCGLRTLHVRNEIIL